MADYAAELEYLDRLYQSVNESGYDKIEKDENADVTAEEEELSGIQRAISILSDVATLPEGGERDVADIAQGNELFATLKNLLARSGRTSNSKNMQPVVTALDEYMSETGVRVRTNAYHMANMMSGRGKQEAIESAVNQAFSDIMSICTEKMMNFENAAKAYLEVREEKKSKPWTLAGKQRRALIRAACVQMEDQRRIFLANQDNIKNIVEMYLQAAETDNRSTVDLSVNYLTKEILSEEKSKRKSDEVDALAKDIAGRIAADEAVSAGSEAISDFEKAASLLNLGISDDKKAEFDPALLYSQYQTLRSNYPQYFAMTGDGLLASNAKVNRILFNDSPGIKAQKAKISAMFYLMTGNTRIPEFIYYWQEATGAMLANYEPGSYFPAKAFPVTVPSINLGAENDARDFVEQVRGRFGPDCLLDIDFMKYSGGEATQSAGLERGDDAVWSDLTKSFISLSEDEEKKQAALNKTSVLQSRYIALQKALGAFGPNPRPANMQAVANENEAANEVEIQPPKNSILEELD